MRKTEDRPHRRARAVIHVSAVSAPLRLCLFALVFLVCGLQGQVKASEEPCTAREEQRLQRSRSRVLPTKGSGWKCAPATGRFPARKVLQLRSPPSQAKSQAVVPEENAFRVLPWALWKTSAAGSAADMASDWPCLGTFCGRRERLHTTRQPRPKQLLEPARTGGAGPLRVLLVLPGQDKEIATPLASTRAPGQGLEPTGC